MGIVLSVLEHVGGRAAQVQTARPEFTVKMPVFTTSKDKVDGVAIWSGKNAPPFVNDEISVGMNHLGAGIVIGYVVLHGYLGVVVRLLAPPAWYVEQSSGKNTVTVFGAEL